MYNPDPDRAHNPHQAARDALRELGHQPGNNPVAQLHHIAADLIRQRHQAQAKIGTLDPDNPPPIADLLNLVDLIGKCATALMPLADTQLDAEEQFQIAVGLGFPRTDLDGRP